MDVNEKKALHFLENTRENLSKEFAQFFKNIVCKENLSNWPPHQNPSV